MEKMIPEIVVCLFYNLAFSILNSILLLVVIVKINSKNKKDDK